MTRINFTTVLVWLLLVFSALFAFFLGWYQWNRYTAAQQEKLQVSHNIALQEQANTELQSQFKDEAHRIAVPDTDREDPEFYSQLKHLTDSAGIRLSGITPAAPVVLPTIGTTAASGKASSSSNSSDTSKKQDEQKQGYSLANMPLGVRPVVVNVSVQGSFQGVNTFVRNVYNFRFSGGAVRYGLPRAININSVQINGGDATGQVKATLMLTRFVYKPDANAASPSPTR